MLLKAGVSARHSEVTATTPSVWWLIVYVQFFVRRSSAIATNPSVPGKFKATLLIKRGGPVNDQALLTDTASSLASMSVSALLLMPSS